MVDVESAIFFYCYYCTYAISGKDTGRVSFQNFHHSSLLCFNAVIQSPIFQDPISRNVDLKQSVLLRACFLLLTEDVTSKRCYNFFTYLLNSTERVKNVQEKEMRMRIEWEGKFFRKSRIRILS